MVSSNYHFSSPCSVVWVERKAKVHLGKPKHNQRRQGGHELFDPLHPPGEDLLLEWLVPNRSSKELEAPLAQLHTRHALLQGILPRSLTTAGDQGLFQGEEEATSWPLGC